MRAKLTIDSITVQQWSDTLTLRANYSDSKEDNTYAEATPSASMTIQITNKNLLGKFKPGQQFYVDFTLVQGDQVK